MIDDLIRLVFPATCAGCGEELLKQEKFICLSCLNDMEATGYETHPGDNDLNLRFAGLVDIQGAVAMWYFDKNGKLQNIIEQLKYKDQPELGVFLGEYAAHYLQKTQFFQAVDTLVPVPLHKSRLRERGYNQSLEICKGISRISGISTANKSLVRHAKTFTQTRKSREERWQNVKQVFSVNKPLGGDLLLVDDVITTGSTLIASIHALMDQETPPKSIRVLSIGMARKE